MPGRAHPTPDRTIAKPTGAAIEANTRTRVTTEELFGGRDEVVIVHRGREYRLRITQNDRLILNA